MSEKQTEQISHQCFSFIPPENLRKPLDLCFQRVWERKIDVKGVKNELTYSLSVQRI